MNVLKLITISALFLLNSGTVFSAEKIKDSKVNFILIYTDDHGYSTAPQCVPSRGGVMVGRHKSKFTWS